MTTSNALRWTLREIARLGRPEGRGLRPPRRTEPDHERWHRVRRRLGGVAFIELLREDLAEAFRTSFALDRWPPRPTTGLDEATAKALVDEAAPPDDTETLAFLRLACRGLGHMEGGKEEDALALIDAALPGTPVAEWGSAWLRLLQEGSPHRRRGLLYGRLLQNRPRVLRALDEPVQDRAHLNEKYNLPYTPDMAAVYLEEP